jgi:predicted ester cyclase
MDTERNKAIVERYYGELNRGNLSVIEELLKADYVAHDPNLPAEQREGVDNVILAVERSRAAMPDQRIELDDVIAERDLVAFRIKLYGRLEDVGDTLDDGREIAITGMGMLRIAGAQIAEGWFNFDHYSLLQQLGALPADTRDPDA